MQKYDSKVAPQINLVKLPLNTRYEFELDQNAEWLKTILDEMNENSELPKMALNDTFLTLKGEIEKKSRLEMGEFLLVEGTIEAKYATECVRTLRPMKLEMSVEIKICFVDESFATTELFSDADETWVEGQTYELYFYNKRTVMFQDMIHEQIFLNYEQYPVLDPDAKLPGVL
jgi:uncharacterized metal-binding protein YceD (DUF177 family)